MQKRIIALAAALTVLLALAGAACFVPGASAAAPALNTYEQQLMDGINEVRAQHGLAKLRLSVPLVAAARAHSTDMGARQYLQHDTLGGETWSKRLVSHGYKRKGYKVWKAGENLAWGAGLYSSPASVIAQWMDSPAHRAVILTKDFRDVGIGAVSCEGYGSVEGTVWFFTLDAGRRVK